MLSYLLTPSHALLIAWSILLVILLFKPHTRRPRWLFALTSFVFALLIWTPIAQILSAPLEYRFQQHPKEAAGTVGYIIQLSGAERPNIAEDSASIQLNDQNGRYFETARLAALYPEAVILFSGGYVSNTSSDLEIAARIYDLLGLKERSIFIGGAPNTYGNAVEVAAYLQEQDVDVNTGALLVTSAMHMPRSILCFQALNLNVIAAPAEPLTPREFRFADWARSPLSTENLRTFDLAMHEWIGLLTYRIKGRIERLWP